MWRAPAGRNLTSALGGPTVVNLEYWGTTSKNIIYRLPLIILFEFPLSPFWCFWCTCSLSSSSSIAKMVVELASSPIFLIMNNYLGQENAEVGRCWALPSSSWIDAELALKKRMTERGWGRIRWRRRWVWCIHGNYRSWRIMYTSIFHFQLIIQI